MRLDANHLVASGHRHVIFGGIDLGQEFELLAIEVDPYPGVSTVTTEPPKFPGERYHARKLGTRDIKIKLAVRAETRDPLDINHAWRAKNALLFRESEERLYLDEEFYINVVAVSASSLQIARDRGIATVTFRAFDPTFYGPAHIVKVGTEPTTFIVLTREQTWPTFHVTGATGTLTITNHTTGERIVLPDVPSDLTVYAEDAKALSADGRVLPINADETDFFPLQPQREHKVSISSGTGTLTYREIER